MPIERSANQHGLRILGVELQDFRGIKNLKLGFSRNNEPLGLVVLAGDNGCGKTSILEAIAIALDRADILPPDAADLDDEARFGSDGFRLRLSVQRNMPGAIIKRDLDLSLQALKTPWVNAATPGFFDGKSGPIPASNSILYRDQLKPISLEYFSARREPEALGATPGPQGKKSEREARRLVELKRSLANAYNRMLRTPGEAGGSAFTRVSNFFSHFDSQKRELDVLFASNDPGSGDEVVLREANKPIPGDITSLKMARLNAARRTDIPVMVPIDRLSSGEMSLLAFAQPLIFRDTPADIVLIDEPEQHLHERWRRHLMTALRALSPSSQFIVATQSREVLESALSDERFILFRDDDPRARIPNTTPEGPDESELEKA